MLQANPYVSLESGKDVLIKKIQLQNAMGTKAVDTSSTLISIFGYQLRDTIQQSAKLCNINSSQLSSLDPKNGKGAINELCTSASQQVNDLHDTLLWGIDAGKEILGTDGLSTEGQAAAQSAIQQTASYGQSVVNRAASNLKEAVAEVNKAASQIQTEKGEPPTASEEIKQEVQTQVAKVEKQLPTTTDVADKVDKVKLDNKLAETPATETTKETKETKTADTKTAETPKTTTTANAKTAEPAKTTTTATTATTTEPKQTTTTNTIAATTTTTANETIDINQGLKKETVDNNIFALNTGTVAETPLVTTPTTETASTPVTTNV